jgi:uncharacterized protein (DUF433 family)
MNRITLEPGKRGGRPCIRGLRITVYDVLSMLSSKMTQQEILEDFPELEPEDILAVLAFAADREHKVYSLAAQLSCCWTRACRDGWSLFSNMIIRAVPTWCCWNWRRRQTRWSGTQRRIKVLSS